MSAPATTDVTPTRPARHDPVTIAPEWSAVDKALQRATQVGSSKLMKGASSASSQPVQPVKPQQHVLSRGEVQRVAMTEHAKSGAVLEKIPELSLDSLNLTAPAHADDRGSNAPLALCPRLRKVTLRYNNFSDRQSAKSIQTGVLDALSELRELALDGCKIEVIPPLVHPRLESLSLAMNCLRAMSEVQFQKLTMLDISGNGPEFTTFNAGAKLPALTFIDISRNGFLSLESISGLNHLQTLLCSGNRLTNLVGIEKMSRLEKLDVSGNRLRYTKLLSTSNPLRACAATLTSLDVSSNEIASLGFFVPMPKLWWLDVSGNAFGSGPVAIDEGLARPASRATAHSSTRRDDIGDAAYDEDDAASTAPSTVTNTSVAARTTRTGKSTALVKGSSASVKPATKTSTKAGSVASRTEGGGGGNSGAVNFFQKISTLVPAVEFLDVSRTSADVMRTVDDLSALSRCKRLTELRADPSLVADEIDKRRESLVREREASRAKKLAQQASKMSKKPALTLEDRMRAAFGDDAAPAAAAEDASDSDGDDSGAPNGGEADDLAEEQVLGDVVARLLPQVDALNGEPLAHGGMDASATPLQLAASGAQQQRPQSARSAANTALAEQEILAKVLDEDTLAALREVGFDANRSASDAASNAPPRPGSAGGGGPLARPGSAGSVRSVASRASSVLSATSRQQAAAAQRVRDELEGFHDEINMSQDYAFEALQRVETRIRWAYGAGAEPPAEAVAKPMHEYWEESSAVRRQEISAELRRQREMRRQRTLAQQTPQRAPQSTSTDAEASTPVAKRDAVDPALNTTPQRTPTKPVGSRSVSAPRPSSSASTGTATSPAPSGAASQQTGLRRQPQTVTEERRSSQGTKGSRSQSDAKSTSVASAAPAERPGSHGGGSSGSKPGAAGRRARSTGSRPDGAASSSASFSASAQLPSAASRPGGAIAKHPSTPPTSGTTVRGPGLRPSGSRSFAEEQAEFKRKMQAEADARRRQAMPHAPPASVGASTPKGTTSKVKRSTSDGATMTAETPPRAAGSMFDRMGAAKVSSSVGTVATATTTTTTTGTSATATTSADPLAKYRLQPVDAAPTTTTAAASTGTSDEEAAKALADDRELHERLEQLRREEAETDAIEAEVVRVETARKKAAESAPGAAGAATADRDGDDDDDSSMGSIPSDDDTSSGEEVESPVKPVVFSSADPRQRTKPSPATGAASGQSESVVSALRPTSASLDPRSAQRRPPSAGTPTDAVPFRSVTRRVSQDGRDGDGTRSSIKVTAGSANASVAPAAGAAQRNFVVPVTGQGVRAPLPGQDSQGRVVAGADPRGSTREAAAKSDDPYKMHAAPTVRRGGGTLNSRRR